MIYMSLIFKKIIYSTKNYFFTTILMFTKQESDHNFRSDIFTFSKIYHAKDTYLPISQSLINFSVNDGVEIFEEALNFRQTPLEFPLSIAIT